MVEHDRPQQRRARNREQLAVARISRHVAISVASSIPPSTCLRLRDALRRAPESAPTALPGWGRRELRGLSRRRRGDQLGDRRQAPSRRAARAGQASSPSRAASSQLIIRDPLEHAARRLRFLFEFLQHAVDQRHRSASVLV